MGEEVEELGEKGVDFGVALDAQNVIAVFCAFHHAVGRPCVDGNEGLLRGRAEVVEGGDGNAVAP